MVSKYLLHHRVNRSTNNQIDVRILPISIPQVLQIAEYGGINIIKFLEFINNNTKRTSFTYLKQVLHQIGERSHPFGHEYGKGLTNLTHKLRH